MSDGAYDETERAIYAAAFVAALSSVGKLFTEPSDAVWGYADLAAKQGHRAVRWHRYITTPREPSTPT